MTCPSRILEMCRECASEVYGARQPTPAYAGAVARLLYGTAAVESGFDARRQIGFFWCDNGGAWGLWQTETAALVDSCRYLQRRTDVAGRAAAWLMQTPADMGWLRSIEPTGLTRLVAGWDRLACLFARVHYLRVPAPVPRDEHAQANYWKRYYNTVRGKGTVQRYLDAWQELAIPWLHRGGAG